MSIAYFDCFSGASGDMILGAMLDAGLALDHLRLSLDALQVPGYSLSAQKVVKQGFAATKFDVRLDPGADRPTRHLQDIREIIERAALSATVRRRAVEVFTRLAEAEAEVHGTTVDEVHFHEVGALDAIVDIVGACIGLEALNIERVVCAPVPLGSGTVRCAHGTMPVPAPAVAILLKGVPLAPCDEVGELTTPTGAALLRTFADEFGPLPAMKIERTGVGAGTRDGQQRANIFRLILGETVEGTQGTDEVDAICEL